MNNKKEELISNNNNTDDYNASNIVSLKGLEPVFLRPGMYIGSTDEKGVQHCLIEIIDNSVDENNAGFCNKIEVELFEDNSISVTDNGRGIPVDIHPTENISAATLVVTTLHAGGKFGGENSSYHRTGGLHGVGASVVNALSDYFEMTIWRDGHEYFQRFTLKKIDNDIIPAFPDDILKEIGDCPIEKTGTRVKFLLNKEKFSSKVYNEVTDEYVTEYYTFNEHTISKRLELLAFLNPGLKLVFINHRDKSIENDKNELENKYCTIDTREDGTVVKTWLANSIINYLDVLGSDMSTSVTEPLMFEKEVEAKLSKNKDVLAKGVFVRIAMQWFSGEKTKINGFVNNIYTPNGGTHVNGFKKALTRALNLYVNENGTDRDKKEFNGVDSNDIIEGLVSAVSVKVEEPQFEGQTKDKLSSKEADSAVYTSTVAFLKKEFEEKPKLAKEIVERSLRSKKAREAAARARTISIQEKTISNFSTPAKLADCQSKDPKMCEIFLVEGDSAGGSAKTARDRKFQAILPLKGKILNTHKSKAEVSKVLANDEINALISSLGCGYGKNFNINKLNYHKIIFMTDADVDGSHIKTLLSTFFYTYLPELLINNHIYMAITPLYRVKKKKGKELNLYLKNDIELEEFKLKNASSLHLYDISRFKGLGEMNPDELKETTMSLETRSLGLIKYDEEIVEEIDDTFDLLMGQDPKLRKEFIETYNK